jgi:hypothetical protein
MHFSLAAQQSRHKGWQLSFVFMLTPMTNASAQVAPLLALQQKDIVLFLL